jgi:hypothetical protein
MREQFGQLFRGGVLHMQPGADAGPERKQPGRPEQFDQLSVAAQHDGQNRMRVKVRTCQQAQLGQDIEFHFLGFINDKDGTP